MILCGSFGDFTKKTALAMKGIYILGYRCHFMMIANYLGYITIYCAAGAAGVARVATPFASQT